MRTFTQLLEARQLDIQDNVINNISTDDLNKYLSIADKFISPESLSVVQYMIAHPDYAKEFAAEGSTNCIADFYAAKPPKDPELKKVYASINKIAKNNRLLEIPNLQTPEQFNSIINKKVAPDEILLDLKSEAGRNAVAKRYEPLVHKLANQWYGKVNLTRDEILSAAWEGLTNAMNGYGKKQVETDEDAEKVKNTTFGQFAAYAIRFAILSDVKNVSQNVRVPISVQNKERKEKGSNRKTNTVSGDKKIGDDEKSKTLFDMVGGVDDGTSRMDYEDLDKLWQEVFKKLEKEFDKNVMFAWYSYMGMNGHEKMKNKDIANKLNCNPSLVTYYCNNVNQYIRKDKSIMKLMTEIYELMKECLHERDHENDLIEDGFNVKDAMENTSMDDE